MKKIEQLSCDAYQAAVVDALTAGDRPSTPELVAHRRICASCRADTEGLAEVWEALGSLPASVPSPGTRDPRMAVNFNVGRPLLAVAATILLLTAGSLWMRAESSSDPELSFESTVMTRLTEVARLQDALGPETVDSLISALEFESSVGVRLVAVSGLELRASDPRVESALRSALFDEDSPHVQLAIIRLLSPRSDAPDVEAFLGRDDLDPAVRTVALAHLVPDQPGVMP